MTEHQGLPVAGYRSQKDIAVSLVNRNKQVEEQVLRILDELATMRGPDAPANPHELALDQRWLSIGRTHIEQGFMAINRAIFKPERVKLDGLSR
jgi:hypothetical protein